MGKRSQQAGAPSDAEAEKLEEQVEKVGRPSVELLTLVSDLIKCMEPELGMQASEGDDERLAQRLHALRHSGLAVDAGMDGLGKEDYDVCALAVQRHFLGAGFGVVEIREAMARVVRPAEGDGLTGRGEQASGSEPGRP